MIVYGDTSALVKLVIREQGTEEMIQLRPQITLLASARIAYVELRASLAAMRRDHRLSSTGLDQAKRQLEVLWHNTSAVEVDAGLVARAGQLAEKEALRGYDAVHLAALERLAPPAQCLLACWDAALRHAASSLGYKLFPTRI